MKDENTFICQACFFRKPLTDLSPDNPKYCNFCQDIIGEECHAKLARTNPTTLPALATKAIKPVPKIETSIPIPDTTQNILVHRGRPCKDLPVDRIKELSNQDMNIRQIAEQTGISPMSISRVLSGKRK